MWSSCLVVQKSRITEERDGVCYSWIWQNSDACGEGDDHSPLYFFDYAAFLGIISEICLHGVRCFSCRLDSIFDEVSTSNRCKTKVRSIAFPIVLIVAVMREACLLFISAFFTLNLLDYLHTWPSMLVCGNAWEIDRRRCAACQYMLPSPYSQAVRNGVVILTCWSALFFSSQLPFNGGAHVSITQLVQIFQEWMLLALISLTVIMPHTVKHCQSCAEPY